MMIKKLLNYISDTTLIIVFLAIGTIIDLAIFLYAYMHNFKITLIVSALVIILISIKLLRSLYKIRQDNKHITHIIQSTTLELLDIIERCKKIYVSKKLQKILPNQIRVEENGKESLDVTLELDDELEEYEFSKTRKTPYINNIKDIL